MAVGGKVLLGRFDALDKRLDALDERVADLTEVHVLTKALVKVVQEQSAEVRRPVVASLDSEETTEVDALMKDWTPSVAQHPLAGMAGAPGANEGGL